MARQDPQINLRVPQHLKDQLEAAAKSLGRSLTAEICARLEASLATTKPDYSSALFKALQELSAAEHEADLFQRELTLIKEAKHDDAGAPEGFKGFRTYRLGGHTLDDAEGLATRLFVTAQKRVDQLSEVAASIRMSVESGRYPKDLLTRIYLEEGFKTKLEI